MNAKSQDWTIQEYENISLFLSCKPVNVAKLMLNHWKFEMSYLCRFSNAVSWDVFIQIIVSTEYIIYINILYTQLLTIYKTVNSPLAVKRI